MVPLPQARLPTADARPLLVALLIELSALLLTASSAPLPQARLPAAEARPRAPQPIQPWAQRPIEPFAPLQIAPLAPLHLRPRTS